MNADAWAAVATGAATVVALYFGTSAEVRSRADRRDAVREQARRVSAWLEWHHTTADDPPHLRTTVRVPRVVVLNNSEEPVWGVTVWVAASDPRKMGETFDGYVDELFEMVPPGVTSRILTWADFGQGGSPSALGLRFRDKDDRWWSRGDDGALRREN
jgi:hypothetical protein